MKARGRFTQEGVNERERQVREGGGVEEQWQEGVAVGLTREWSEETIKEEERST